MLGYSASTQNNVETTRLFSERKPALKNIPTNTHSLSLPLSFSFINSFAALSASAINNKYNLKAHARHEVIADQITKPLCLRLSSILSYTIGLSQILFFPSPISSWTSTPMETAQAHNLASSKSCLSQTIIGLQEQHAHGNHHNPHPAVLPILAVSQKKHLFVAN